MAVCTFIHKTMCSFKDNITCVLIRLHKTIHAFGQIQHTRNSGVIKVSSKISTMDG